MGIFPSTLHVPPDRQNPIGQFTSKNTNYNIFIYEIKSSLPSRFISQNLPVHRFSQSQNTIGPLGEIACMQVPCAPHVFGVH